MKPTGGPGGTGRGAVPAQRVTGGGEVESNHGISWRELEGMLTEFGMILDQKKNYTESVYVIV